MPKGKYIRSVRPVIVPVGPSIAYVELTRGQYALIDSCHAERVGKYNWTAIWNKSGNAFYARRRPRSEDSSADKCSLHRSIMGIRPNPSSVGDHINGNTLDCRLSCNLRWATRAQNAQNSGSHKGNMLGIKGVKAQKENGKESGAFLVYIRAHGKQMYIGTLRSVEAATLARKEAEDKYFGQFRRIA